MVLDEALVDFADSRPRDGALHLLEDHPRPLVVRTFSKAWGLAACAAATRWVGRAPSRCSSASPPLWGWASSPRPAPWRPCTPPPTWSPAAPGRWPWSATP